MTLIDRFLRWLQKRRCLRAIGMLERAEMYLQWTRKQNHAGTLEAIRRLRKARFKAFDDLSREFPEVRR